MFKQLTRITFILLFALALVAQPLSVRTAYATGGDQVNPFVKRYRADLLLNNMIFRFAGTNNYYLMYKSRAMVDDVLETAAANNFRVLRMWGSLDIGNQDGSDSVHGKADGVYFQYWDGAAPAFNDGADGLEHLDYVVAKAGELGIKLVIPFVNNWSSFGGIDQYVKWRGGAYHDDFYTDPTIRQWYKDWIAHLLNRTNTITGIQYKNDPTIMTWELGNEPRCKGSGLYPPSPTCSPATLTAWADEMSTFIKTIDKNHLVSVGDEGFYCDPSSSDWIDNCGEGVDTIAFTKLPNIDVMSFHLYPDHWGRDAAWGTQWIKRHFADARALNKPAMLGEYGWQDKSTRNVVFKEWTDTVYNSKGAGALYWILSGKQDDGSLYADYDGFTVYCPSPVCTLLGNFAKMMVFLRTFSFGPVADNDTVVVDFDTAATLNATANDVAYGYAMIRTKTIDLDPATEGQQLSLTVPKGMFSASLDGTVTFVPTPGVPGESQAAYTVLDSARRISNVATITVTVKPNPLAAIQLFSFETGLEGWAPASWNASAGVVTQSADYHSDGNFSLEIDTTGTGGGWFGVTFPEPVNISEKSILKYDLRIASGGTNAQVAFNVGPSWNWCEGGGWGWISGSQDTTAEINLYSLSCPASDLNEVRTLYIWISGGGPVYIDNVRAE